MSRVVTHPDGRLSCYDIEDVVAFVRFTVAKRLKIKLLDPQEREDLEGEGFIILLKLAENYKPHMDGYAKAGSFAGYCSFYLPKKLLSAWYRMHPEHVSVSEEQADGTVKKVHRFGDAPRSLDEKADQKEDGIDSYRYRVVGDFIQQ